jgi:hypothetical protein
MKYLYTSSRVRSVYGGCTKIDEGVQIIPRSCDHNVASLNISTCD